MHSEGMMDLRCRLRELAQECGDKDAVIEVSVDGSTKRVSWRQFEMLIDARVQRLHSVDRIENAVVAVPADNSICAIVKILAVLCAGFIVWPMSPELPQAKRASRFNDIAALHGTVVADYGDIASPVISVLVESAHLLAGRPRGGYLLETGGSTGVPTLIHIQGPVSYSRRLIPNPLEIRTGWMWGQQQLVVGPIYHAAPFTFMLHGLLDANTVIIQRAFIPDQTLSLIEAGVQWMQATPTHLRTIIDHSSPKPSVFRSLNGLLHTAARCDMETKKAWINLIGPCRLFESYTATEGIGATLVRGDEWLERPGTVGRGIGTQIKILNEEGRQLAPGRIGEIFLRRASVSKSALRNAKTTVDGFSSVGDVGWIDNDGYLYLSSRRHDMFTVGGENVYPEEIELEMRAHPAVHDCAVVKVADNLLGNVVGALIVPWPCVTISKTELREFLRKRLAGPKVPRTIRMVEQIPRTASGKIRRSELASLLM